jgi:plasmid stabilization system protein ParE
MALKLKITSKAQKDVMKAYEWYEDKSKGLGLQFIHCVNACMYQIINEPGHFQKVFANSVKRALVGRFPYAIYFVEKESSLIVFGIFHQRVNPSRWKSRKRK